MCRPLLREGIERLHEMVGEEEIEHDKNRLRRLKVVIQAFPAELTEFFIFSFEGFIYVIFMITFVIN